MSNLDPAWSVEYAIRGSDTDGMLQGWKWEGEISNDRYRLRGGTDTDPAVLGTVGVTSSQPYKKDAIEDTLRAAMDLCGVLGASIGGLSVAPDETPVDVEQLAGAKSGGLGVGVSVSASLSLTQKLDERDHWLQAVDRLRSDPAIRADLDTFAVAKRESDQAARTLLLFRVFDAYVRQLLEDSPPLLRQEEIDALRNGITGEAPDRLDPTDSERLEATIAAALGRLRTYSRHDILDAHLRENLGLDVERSMLKRIDRRRGRVAHNPTEHDEQSPQDSEADSHLFSIVHAIIKHRLGL